MRKLGLALLLGLLGFAPAQAQNFTMPPPAGVTVGGVAVVSSCGGQSLLTAQPAIVTMDVTGKLCVNAGTLGWSNTNKVITWDGTNQVTFKSASTAAVATDTSEIVQLNPLSPGIIPLGQATKANSVPVTFASDQDVCSYAQKSSVAINITSATTTQLVAISGSTLIYICGFSFTISEVVTTPNTLQFEYGTSTNCTGTNKLTGLYGGGGVTAGDPIFIHDGGGSSTVFTVPSANGLCALTAIGASGSFQGVLTFTCSNEAASSLAPDGAVLHSAGGCCGHLATRSSQHKSCFLHLGYWQRCCEWDYARDCVADHRACQCADVRAGHDDLRHRGAVRFVPAHARQLSRHPDHHVLRGF